MNGSLISFFINYKGLKKKGKKEREKGKKISCKINESLEKNEKKRKNWGKLVETMWRSRDIFTLDFQVGRKYKV